MRLPAAAALVLLATPAPAPAQQLDTRRFDVHQEAGGTACGFHAYPGLTLVDGTKSGHGKIANWSGSAAEGGAQLRLVWQPAERGWRTPPYIAVGFQVPADANLSRDTVTGATLAIDGGKPIPLLFNASGDGLIFAANRDTDNVGARIITSDKIVLQMGDTAGQPLHIYSWDASRLADGVETVSVVGWSCTSN